MSFSDDVYKLLQTSSEIADLRVKTMPADSNMDPLIEWRDEVIAHFAEHEKEALDEAFRALQDPEEAGPEVAQYLHQEVNAVQEFQASVLEMKGGSSSAQDDQGSARSEGRPLQRSLKMTQTVLGSLKELLDLNKRGKAVLTILDEIYGIFAA